MTIDLYILAFSAVTVGATIFMGFWTAKRSKTASDFFVAGRSVGVGMNASAISGEYLSAASFMGIAGMVMSSGYDALWYPVCYACGYLFLLLFIAGPLRRFGAYTIPDFAEGRFDSPVFRKIAVVFVLFIGFFYTMPQMKGAGTTLAYIFPGLPYWAGVVLVGAVITLNVALGGMKGITLVQAFQYWAKMFAISVPIFVLMAVYGHYGKQIELNTPADEFRPAGTNQSSQGFVSIAESGRGTAAFEQFGVTGDGKMVPLIIERSERGAVLPAKAPRDATWLNPFGPLTTKAAKNAAAAIGKKVLEAGYANIEFFEVTPSTLLRPPADASLQTKIIADIFPIKMTVMPTQPLRWRVSQLASNCAALTGDRYLIATNLATANVEFGNTTPLNNSQYVAAVHAVLQTNETIWLVRDDGRMPTFATNRLTVLREGRTVRIFAAKNAAAAIGKRVEANNQSGEKFLEEMWKLAAINGISNRIGLKFEELKTDFSRRAGDRSYPFGDLNPGFALREFAEHHGLHRMLVAESTQPTLTNNIYVTARFSADEWDQDVRAAMRSNGVEVIVASAALIVVPVAKHADYETCYKAHGLDAFPLRTSVQKRADETRETIPLRSDITAEQHLTVALDSPTVAQALAVYAELTGRKLVPNTNSLAEHVDDLLNGKLSKLKLITRGATPESRVRLHNDGMFTAGEVKAAIEEQLRTNGVAIVAAGEKGFRLVAAEVTRLTSNGGDQSLLTSAATAEKAWLAKHEKPLALLYTYSLIIAIVCGTAGLPHILVRFYTNPDGTAAKKTTMWVMILIGVFYVFPPVFGVIGRNLLPELYSGVGAKGTDKIVLELPRILNAKYPPLGSILSGITCAGAFAAFMSTFSGLLVSMTGALAHDVYGRILRPKATAEQRMRMFKIGAVIIGAVAILLGSFVEPLEINFMVGQAFAIAAASYFPLLFMAVWWRKLTMKGAAIGMLTGGVCALAAGALTNFSNLASDKGPMGKVFAGFAPLNDFWAAHPLLRILCEQPAIWAVPLAITLMIVVSKLTAREVPGDSRMKMLVLHAPEQLGLKQEYIQEHQPH